MVFYKKYIRFFYASIVIIAAIIFVSSIFFNKVDRDAYKDNSINIKNMLAYKDIFSAFRTQKYYRAFLLSDDLIKNHSKYLSINMNLSVAYLKAMSAYYIGDYSLAYTLLTNIYVLDSSSDHGKNAMLYSLNSALALVQNGLTYYTKDVCRLYAVGTHTPDKSQSLQNALYDVRKYCVYGD